MFQTVETEEAQQAGTGEHPGDIVVLCGLDDWLRTARSEAREHVEAELGDVVEELAAIEVRRDELIRRCNAWLSLRAVGELAGLSHTQIRRITS
ncbi:hypothetical protein [Nocardia sp. NPDC051750]|uniref:hypothetical protein n=1 Tax=Nocardia sp. NPDC051750 TaxID=3364325 RepID=UPI0037A452EE